MPSIPEIAVRITRAQDVAPLRALYVASVEAVAAGAYSAKQIAAWAGYAASPAFLGFILDPLTLVATHHQRPVGFTGIESSGHIALLYVHPITFAAGSEPRSCAKH